MAKKALSDRPTLSPGKPKKVKFAKGTKKALPTKTRNKEMAAEIVGVDTCDVSKISSNEWPAYSDASRPICNEICMLHYVMNLDVSIIVRHLVGEVAITTCGTLRIECENEVGVVVHIDLFDAISVLDLRVNLFSLQKMRQSSIRLEYPSYKPPKTQKKLGTI